MADRHWHWVFRCDDYMSMFRYATEDEAQDALDWVHGECRDKEVFELPCDCGQPIVIKEEPWTA